MIDASLFPFEEVENLKGSVLLGLIQVEIGRHLILMVPLWLLIAELSPGATQASTTNGALHRCRLRFVPAMMTKSTLSK